MSIRNATATWNGGLKSGDGRMALGSGAWEGPFSFSTRFEEEPGTNPEELIGAALAGCYSMQLGAMLEAGGQAAESVQTTAAVHLHAGPEIPRIDLTTVVRGAGLDDETVQKTAQEAKQACLIHNVLAGVDEITLSVELAKP